MKGSYDVVIIGSGFGGSIPAFRIARAQQAAGKPASKWGMTGIRLTYMRPTGDTQENPVSAR